MTDLVTPADLRAEMLRLSRDLDSAHSDLIDASHAWAKAENTYRLAKANAYLASSGTVDSRKASVDKATSEERLQAHTSEALKVAALERVRSTRAQLSALQSISAAVKSEIEMAGRT